MDSHFEDFPLPKKANVLFKIFFFVLGLTLISVKLLTLVNMSYSLHLIAKSWPLQKSNNQTYVLAAYSLATQLIYLCFVELSWHFSLPDPAKCYFKTDHKQKQNLFVGHKNHKISRHLATNSCRPMNWGNRNTIHQIFCSWGCPIEQFYWHPVESSGHPIEIFTGHPLEIFIAFLDEISNSWTFEANLQNSSRCSVESRGGPIEIWQDVL